MLYEVAGYPPSCGCSQGNPNRRAYEHMGDGERIVVDGVTVGAKVGKRTYYSEGYEHLAAPKVQWLDLLLAGVAVAGIVVVVRRLRG